MIHSAIHDFRIIPLSDRSVLVSFGNIIDQPVNEKVLLLHAALLHTGFEGFVESVPAYCSLAVFYDVPLIKMQVTSTAFDYVKNRLLQLMQLNFAESIPVSSVIKIPVCYAEEFGLDIIELANARQLSIQEVIRLHSSVIYRVYMIGFMPGFAYMGPVNEKLITPRKELPRLNVPAGSVGIAGAQTGIYPIDSPGGWQIIGKTPVPLFNTCKASPCLLSPGDQVQFIPIDQHKFNQANVH